MPPWWLEGWTFSSFITIVGCVLFHEPEMSDVYGVTQLELEQVRLLVLFWSRPDRQTQIFYCLQPDAHLITLILWGQAWTESEMKAAGECLVGVGNIVGNMCIIWCLTCCCISDIPSFCRCLCSLSSSFQNNNFLSEYNWNVQSGSSQCHFHLR